MHTSGLCCRAVLAVCHVRVFCRNGQRYGDSCYGIGNRTQAFEWYHFNDLVWPLTQNLRSCRYWTLNVSETVKD